LSVKCRSIKNKKSSIKEILDSQNIDIAVCSELNINWKPPKFKGFLAFQKKSNKRIHGLAMYVSSHLSDSVLHIPSKTRNWKLFMY
jgi:hypothetical protein